MTALPSAFESVESQQAATPNHALELERQLQRRVLLRETLAQCLGGVGSCLLEPGCGHGHWLTAYAAQYPDTVCVGLDLLRERIEKARAKAARAGLKQVHFIKAELLECLDCLPAGLKLQNIVFLFPDPWPKKRHHRRRMIQMDTLSALAERATEDAKLYFRSDDADYVEWTREMLHAHTDWQLDESIPWLFEQETLFQRKMVSYQSLQARRIPKK
jgi:tRNA (guanine-N7-)-methyltransferase